MEEEEEYQETLIQSAEMEQYRKLKTNDAELHSIRVQLNEKEYVVLQFGKWQRNNCAAQALFPIFARFLDEKYKDFSIHDCYGNENALRTHVTLLMQLTVHNQNFENLNIQKNTFNEINKIFEDLVDYIYKISNVPLMEANATKDLLVYGDNVGSFDILRGIFLMKKKSKKNLVYDCNLPVKTDGDNTGEGDFNCTFSLFNCKNPFLLFIAYGVAEYKDKEKLAQQLKINNKAASKLLSIGKAFPEKKLFCVLFYLQNHYTAAVNVNLLLGRRKQNPLYIYIDQHGFTIMQIKEEDLLKEIKHGESYKPKQFVTAVVYENMKLNESPKSPAESFVELVSTIRDRVLPQTLNRLQSITEVFNCYDDSTGESQNELCFYSELENILANNNIIKCISVPNRITLINDSTNEVIVSIDKANHLLELPPNGVTYEKYEPKVYIPKVDTTTPGTHTNPFAVYQEEEEIVYTPPPPPPPPNNNNSTNNSVPSTKTKQQEQQQTIFLDELKAKPTTSTYQWKKFTLTGFNLNIRTADFEAVILNNIETRRFNDNTIVAIFDDTNNKIIAAFKQITKFWYYCKVEETEDNFTKKILPKLQHDKVQPNYTIKSTSNKKSTTKEQENSTTINNTAFILKTNFIHQQQYEYNDRIDAIANELVGDTTRLADCSTSVMDRVTLLLSNLRNPPKTNIGNNNNTNSNSGSGSGSGGAKRPRDDKKDDDDDDDADTNNNKKDDDDNDDDNNNNNNDSSSKKIKANFNNNPHQMNYVAAVKRQMNKIPIVVTSKNNSISSFNNNNNNNTASATPTIIQQAPKQKKPLPEIDSEGYILVAKRVGRRYKSIKFYPPREIPYTRINNDDNNKSTSASAVPTTPTRRNNKKPKNPFDVNNITIQNLDKEIKIYVSQDDPEGNFENNLEADIENIKEQFVEAPSNEINFSSAIFKKKLNILNMAIANLSATINADSRPRDEYVPKKIKEKNIVFHDITQSIPGYSLPNLLNHLKDKNLALTIITEVVQVYNRIRVTYTNVANFLMETVVAKYYGNVVPTYLENFNFPSGKNYKNRNGHVRSFSHLLLVLISNPSCYASDEQTPGKTKTMLNLFGLRHQDWVMLYQDLNLKNKNLACFNNTRNIEPRNFSAIGGCCETLKNQYQDMLYVCNYNLMNRLNTLFFDLGVDENYTWYIVKLIFDKMNWNDNNNVATTTKSNNKNNADDDAEVIGEDDDENKNINYQESDNSNRLEFGNSTYKFILNNIAASDCDTSNNNYIQLLEQFSTRFCNKFLLKEKNSSEENNDYNIQSYVLLSAAVNNIIYQIKHCIEEDDEKEEKEEVIEEKKDNVNVEKKVNTKIKLKPVTFITIDQFTISKMQKEDREKKAKKYSYQFLHHLPTFKPSRLQPSKTTKKFKESLSPNEKTIKRRKNRKKRKETLLQNEIHKSKEEDIEKEEVKVDAEVCRIVLFFHKNTEANLKQGTKLKCSSLSPSFGVKYTVCPIHDLDLKLGYLAYDNPKQTISLLGKKKNKDEVQIEGIFDNPKIKKHCKKLVNQERKHLEEAKMEGFITESYIEKHFANDTGNRAIGLLTNGHYTIVQYTTLARFKTTKKKTEEQEEEEDNNIKDYDNYNKKRKRPSFFAQKQLPNRFGNDPLMYLHVPFDTANLAQQALGFRNGYHNCSVLYQLHHKKVMKLDDNTVILTTDFNQSNSSHIVFGFFLSSDFNEETGSFPRPSDDQIIFLPYSVIKNYLGIYGFQEYSSKINDKEIMKQLQQNRWDEEKPFAPEPATFDKLLLQTKILITSSIQHQQLQLNSDYPKQKTGSVRNYKSGIATLVDSIFNKIKSKFGEDVQILYALDEAFPKVKSLQPGGNYYKTISKEIVNRTIAVSVPQHRTSKACIYCNKLCFNDEPTMTDEAYRELAFLQPTTKGCFTLHESDDEATLKHSPNYQVVKCNSCGRKFNRNVVAVIHSAEAVAHILAKGSRPPSLYCVSRNYNPDKKKNKTTTKNTSKNKTTTTNTSKNITTAKIDNNNHTLKVDTTSKTRSNNKTRKKKDF